MDQDNHTLLAGVPGQIVIGEAGVASCYTNQPNLTATRFPKDALAGAQAVANGWTQAHLSGVFVALGAETAIRKSNYETSDLTSKKSRQLW